VVLTPGAEDFDPAAHPEGHDDMLVPIEEGEATPEGAIDDEELAGNVELF
jgi:hypothetical protein